MELGHSSECIVTGYSVGCDICNRVYSGGVVRCDRVHLRVCNDLPQVRLLKSQRHTPKHLRGEYPPEGEGAVTYLKTLDSICNIFRR